MTRWLAVALAFAVALAALAGCSGTERSDETTPSEAVSSATVEATMTAPPGEESAAAGTGTTTPGQVDQTDLQAELEAIERELDAMSLPDDADFGDIESALQ